MATFEVQVEGLTGLSITSTSSPTQNELTQFLTDGAKEIINILPQNLLELCSSEQTFTSTALGSEAEVMNTGKVSSVFRNDGEIDQPCRRIPERNKGRFSDPSDMSYATITDPVYYITDNKLNVLPEGGSCKYAEVQYPTVNYGDSSVGIISLTGVTATKANLAVFSYIAHGLSAGDTVLLSNFSEMTEVNGITSQISGSIISANTFRLEGIDSSNYSKAETTGGNVVKFGGFPDEAEYLIALYGALKTLQNKMSSKISDLPSEVPDPPSVFEIPTLPQDVDIDLSDVPDLPDFNEDVLVDFADAETHLANEDPELVASRLSIVAAKISDFNAKIQKATYDISIFQAELGKTLQKHQAETGHDLSLFQAEIGAEVSRYQQDLAKFDKDLANYGAKIQTHTMDYQWLQSQYTQIKSDYMTGLQMLTTGSIAGPPQQQ